jgi:hypothetical protein
MPVTSDVTDVEAFFRGIGDDSESCVDITDEMTNEREAV